MDMHSEIEFAKQMLGILTGILLVVMAGLLLDNKLLLLFSAGGLSVLIILYLPITLDTIRRNRD